MKLNRSFASDNSSGIHPEILKAIANANSGHAVAYGYDPFTESAINKFKQVFGKDIGVFFVFNGTAANVLGLKSSTQPFNSIICAETAHLNQDECGAPERFTGCKLLTIPTSDGKITIEGIETHVHDIGFEHHAQPRAVSITQATEYGTVYSPKEIRAIADYCHKNEMILHMDGARLANAAASLGVDLLETSGAAGVDVLSFGGTKNGMMYGEAVIFFNAKLARDFKYTRKQGMQLASKMRFISAQFEALLSNNLWLKNAQHANEMAKLLLQQVSKISEIKITQKVEANAVFAVIPKKAIKPLQEKFFFYPWKEEMGEVRWMTSFDTTTEDVENFVSVIKQTIKA